MSNRRAALVVAFVVLAVGLVFAFAPVSAEGLACGNAFSANLTEAVGASVFVGSEGLDYVGACEDALNWRRWIAFGLMAIAGLGLLFGLLTAKAGESAAEQSQQEPR